MITLSLLILILAFLCAALALFGVGSNYNLTALGLLLVTIVLLIGQVG